MVSITTIEEKDNTRLGCDLLEKSYLCGINNNAQALALLQQRVVICLKSLTFVVSITTRVSIIQLYIGCDLLEKSYLCGINNNSAKRHQPAELVVICLKSLTFVVSITTRSALKGTVKQL